MYRIFYVSTASPKVTKEVFEEIVSNAAETNKKLGLSGALAFNGFNFAQVLEGEEAQVKKVYDSIRADERHDGVIMISEKPVSERMYPEWGMIKYDSYLFDDLIKSMAF